MNQPVEALPAQMRPGWRKVSEELPPRSVPVLIAWKQKMRGARIYDVAKFTGKRWLETIPEADNAEFMAPDYWRPIEAPDLDDISIVSREGLLRETAVRGFLGWLSGKLPELHSVEVPKLAEAWEEYKQMVEACIRDGAYL